MRRDLMGGGIELKTWLTIFSGNTQNGTRCPILSLEKGLGDGAASTDNVFL